MSDVRPFIPRRVTAPKPSRQVLADLVRDLTTITLLEPPTVIALAHYAHAIAVRLRASDATDGVRGSTPRRGGDAMKQQQEIRIGDEVKDRVTQIVGIVIAKTEVLFGEPQVTVQARELKDGSPMAPITVPLRQVMLLQADVLHLDVQQMVNGADPRRV